MSNLASKFFQNQFAFLLIVTAVATAVMLPVLFNGIPVGYDLPHHFQCAFTFYESIVNGDFYPSWSLLRNYGYGGMEIRLYPPISHYSLALFYLVTQNWHLAAWLTITFYSILGSLGIYFWAREVMPARNAVFAGCVYAILPYHLNQIYNTFFFAEYVGSAILPFTFLFIARVCRRGKALDVIGLAVSYAALILTHLPLTVIGSICFLIYSISLFKREKLLSQIIKLGTGVLAGLVSTSFFWLKVIQEKDLLAKTINYTDPWLENFRLHFLFTPLQVFEGNFRETIYENSSLYYDLMMLCAVIFALSCSLPFLIRSKKKIESNIKGVWWIFGFSIFLTAPFSVFIWELLPFFQEVQFPWRWVSIVTITAAMISAVHIDQLFVWLKSEKRPYALIIFGCILAVTTFSFSQFVRGAPHMSLAETENSIAKIKEDKGFTFWWTIWTKEEFQKNQDKISAEDRLVDIQKWTATEREFQISEGNSTEIRVAVFYHPNWKAQVNGVPAELHPGKDGAVLISIPQKSSTVSITFEETTLVKAGKFLSKLTCLCWLFFILLFSFRKFSVNKAKL